MTKPEAEAQRISTEHARHRRALEVPDPWFGELSLTREDDGKLLRYKIGRREQREERILDWRHPIGRAYYELSPGEAFELERPFAELFATCAQRATVSANEAGVFRVELKSESGQWDLLAEGDGFVHALSHRRRTPVAGLPDITALLSKEQYGLITASHHRPVIIQGRAGSGKTTVALYRVSWLAHPDSTPGATSVDPAKVLIVMFNKALSTFVAQSLKPLELEAATLDTFHGWALNEIRAAYKGQVDPEPTLPRGYEVASALKKQVGMLPALEDFVQRQEGRLFQWLEEKLPSYDKNGDWLQRAKRDDLPVARRLRRLRREAREAKSAASGKEQARLEQIRLIFDRAHRRMTQYKDELLVFLTNSALLAPYLREASTSEFETLARCQRELQGGGASRRAGPKVAFDDLALLLRLIQLKNGGYPRGEEDDEPRVFDHLVIDEAQDFGALELKVLLASVRSRTGVTIVGDLNQKIMPQVEFMGWDALADELGIGGVEVTELEVAHRSTRPIIELADSVAGVQTLGGFAGTVPSLTLTESAEASLEQIVALAFSALEDHPEAHVCIVCPKRSAAEVLFSQLEPSFAEAGYPLRLGHNRSFAFSPGVTVTNRRQIKGLEFESVIVVDPLEEHYPDSTQGRRDLYTVMTRAKNELHLVSAGPVTPLLDAACARKLLSMVDQSVIPEVTFTEEDETPFEI